MNLAELSWPKVEALSKSMPVVIPIAALEQHGHHLPVFTDSIQLGELVRRVSGTMGDRVLFTPLMWLGNSHHHMDFPGTMSAEPRLYLDLLSNLTDNLIHHGFRRIVLLNGHGGNIVPSAQAMFEVRQKYRERNDLLLLSSAYWHLGAKPAEADRSFEQQVMGHACEWETSMMLRIAPQLVGDIAKTQPVDQVEGFDPSRRAWITKDRSTVGHIGDPRAATAEKGETLLKLFTADIVALLERMIAWDGKSWDG